ncbi:MAG: hypothetical protein ACK5GN_10575 [Pseudomonadota bacterium]|jgi:cytidine deaminase
MPLSAPISICGELSPYQQWLERSGCSEVLVTTFSDVVLPDRVFPENASLQPAPQWDSNTLPSTEHSANNLIAHLTQVERRELTNGVDVSTVFDGPWSGTHISTEALRSISEATRALAERLRAPAFTTLLSENGRLFFGLPSDHSHPVLYGSSVACALSIAVTAGHHSIPLVVTYESPSTAPQCTGSDLDRLSEHLPGGMPENMHILRIWPDRYQLSTYRELCPYQSERRTRPEIRTQALDPYIQLAQLDIREGEAISAHVLAPDALVGDLLVALKERIANSSADGETRPGRKRHAACVWTADGRVYFGVNLRAEVRQVDRCAELSAISAAVLAGDGKRIVGVMVYSPDYHVGAVCCCGRCQDTLGDCIDPATQDMAVVYANEHGVFKRELYKALGYRSYGEAEGSVSSRTS